MNILVHTPIFRFTPTPEQVLQKLRNEYVGKNIDINQKKAKCRTFPFYTDLNIDSNYYRNNIDELYDHKLLDEKDEKYLISHVIALEMVSEIIQFSEDEENFSVVWDGASQCPAFIAKLLRFISEIPAHDAGAFMKYLNDITGHFVKVFDALLKNSKIDDIQERWSKLDFSKQADTIKQAIVLGSIYGNYLARKMYFEYDDLNIRTRYPKSKKDKNGADYVVSDKHNLIGYICFSFVEASFKQTLVSLCKNSYTIHDYVFNPCFYDNANSREISIQFIEYAREKKNKDGFMHFNRLNIYVMDKKRWPEHCLYMLVYVQSKYNIIRPMASKEMLRKKFKYYEDKKDSLDYVVELEKIFEEHKKMTKTIPRTYISDLIEMVGDRATFSEYCKVFLENNICISHIGKAMIQICRGGLVQYDDLNTVAIYDDIATINPSDEIYMNFAEIIDHQAFIPIFRYDHYAEHQRVEFEFRITGDDMSCDTFLTYYVKHKSKKCDKIVIPMMTFTAKYTILDYDTDNQHANVVILEKINGIWILKIFEPHGTISYGLANNLVKYFTSVIGSEVKYQKETHCNLQKYDDMGLCASMSYIALFENIFEHKSEYMSRYEQMKDVMSEEMYYSIVNNVIMLITYILRGCNRDRKDDLITMLSEFYPNDPDEKLYESYESDMLEEHDEILYQKYEQRNMSIDEMKRMLHISFDLNFNLNNYYLDEEIYSAIKYCLKNDLKTFKEHDEMIGNDMNVLADLTFLYQLMKKNKSIFYIYDSNSGPYVEYEDVKKLHHKIMEDYKTTSQYKERPGRQGFTLTTGMMTSYIAKYASSVEGLKLLKTFREIKSLCYEEEIQISSPSTDKKFVAFTNTIDTLFKYDIIEDFYDNRGDDTIRQIYERNLKLQ